MIPKNAPPNVQDRSVWSPEFLDFLKCCLTKSPAERASAKQLRQHPFVRSATSLGPVAELVSDCMEAIKHHRVEQTEAFNRQTTTMLTTYKNIVPPLTLAKHDETMSGCLDYGGTVVMKGQETQEGTVVFKASDSAPQTTVFHPPPSQHIPNVGGFALELPDGSKTTLTKADDFEASGTVLFRTGDGGMARGTMTYLLGDNLSTPQQHGTWIFRAEGNIEATGMRGPMTSAAPVVGEWDEAGTYRLNEGVGGAAGRNGTPADAWTSGTVAADVDKLIEQLEVQMEVEMRQIREKYRRKIAEIRKAQQQ
mmetsp:Transcript_50558/g.109922  ORF Transcript_50558/g.109922 Transcript_50558/m.109922 type:complete len:308 (+) Transcript_50558:517-1440(+)